jgi:hypothetical protein
MTLLVNFYINPPNLLIAREQYCAERKKVMDKQYNQYERDPKSNK